MKKVLGWVLAIFLGSTLPAGQSTGFDNPLSRESLRDLHAVYVEVEEVAPEVQQDGFTVAVVTRLVHARLNQANIRVLSKEQWYEQPGTPYLYVHANVLKLSETGEYIYAVRASFKQTVYPVRKPIEILGADTWSVGGRIGITPSLKKIQDALISQVDRFIAAYRSVNPPR